MIVSVRDITAKCRSCGGTDFAPSGGGEANLATTMTCTRCAAATTYRELLEQIGEEAIRRANEAIEGLRKKGPGPRKPRK